MDVFLGLNKEENTGKSHKSYIEKLKQRMRQAYDIASREAG